jgi:hypothetical protein
VKERQSLKLTGSKPLKSGTVILTYNTHDPKNYNR